MWHARDTECSCLGSAEREADAARERARGLPAAISRAATCAATSEDEQAVSMAAAAPCRPNAYATRPAATLAAPPGVSPLFGVANVIGSALRKLGVNTGKDSVTGK